MPAITIYEKYDWEFECQYNDQWNHISQVTRMVTWDISEDAMNIIKYKDIQLARFQMKKEFENIIL